MSLDFDLSIVSIALNIGGASYTLSEASEGSASEWRNAVINCSRFSKGNVSGIVGLAETSSLLVSLCLSNGEGNRVPVATIRSWPARVVKSLFEKAKEISELREGGEGLEDLVNEREALDDRIADLRGDAAKNESSDTAGGSS